MFSAYDAKNHVRLQLVEEPMTMVWLGRAIYNMRPSHTLTTI